jgi:large subunit ribosomal protein LP0
MSRREISEEKQAYEANVNRLLDTYEKIVFCNMDNVTSQQMHNVRRDLRGKAEILMGKKTMQRKIILRRAEAASATALDKAMKTKFVDDNLLSGNVALAFTSAPISELNEVFLRYRNQAPARVGAVAPCDVVVAAGNTGMEPTMTSFFQALNIATKISKGTVEIISDKKVLATGDKVDTSTAALLQKLKISPFFYAVEVMASWEKGVLFTKEDLSITEESMEKQVLGAINNVTALSLGAGVLTEASFPHVVTDGFKNLLAACIETEYEFEEFDGKNLKKSIKEGKAAPAAAAAAAPAASKAAAKAPEPEEEEDEFEGGLGGLF